MIEAVIQSALKFCKQVCINLEYEEHGYRVLENWQKLILLYINRLIEYGVNVHIIESLTHTLDLVGDFLFDTF